MIGCAAARAVLLSWLDGELVGDDRDVLEGHLRTCPSCRAHADDEARLNDVVRSAVPCVPAPDALRERISVALTPPSRRRWWGAVAAAAVLVVGAAAWNLPRPAPPAPDLARLAADTHLRYGRGQLPLEVRSAQAGEVSRWFRGRVPFDLVLPDHPATESRPYVLEGGRLVALGDDYAAYVAYRLDDTPVSLLVTSTDHARPLGGDVVTSGSIEFHVVSRAGLRVITWSDRGLTYALASDATLSGARSCLVCHGSASERRRLEGFEVPRT